MSQKAKNPVKTVETTFRILEQLKRLDGAGVTELARELDLPKSTVHNYLATLEQERFVVNEDAEYRVGVGFLDLGGYARDQVDIYSIAQPEVEKLAEETGELANLLVEEHGLGSYIQREHGENAVRIEAHVGTRVPLHATGVGKAVLAHLPTERVDEILELHGLPPFTENTITDRTDLLEQLDVIRERGYAFDDGERKKGLRCVGAPILDDGERVVGAVSVSGPTRRLDGERYAEEIPKQLLETVNVIELNVMYL